VEIKECLLELISDNNIMFEIIQQLKLRNQNSTSKF
jgi:hypothetical protein